MRLIRQDNLSNIKKWSTQTNVAHLSLRMRMRLIRSKLATLRPGSRIRIHLLEANVKGPR